ncbi:urease subunit beta [Nonomuraea africana]|uniref:urease n=1 Tax=Nonomuraea africana TaxID=46171 RepID=A0ABR9KDG6_9ACTN|nr:urease subunit beta [Nonomuraea africana]MBE1560057.1 urease subunit gamma/beta [Nonomuraea africana]
MPEATALIAHAACEAARDGARVEDAVTAARQALTATDVLPGVPHLLNEIQVEAVFDDGTKLIIITDPIPAADDPQAAPGAVLAAPATVPAHADPVTITVTNTGGVPVSVSSHYHFFEANRALAFDRASAYGTRLALQVGQVIVFDPGTPRTVTLTPLGGNRVVIGFAGLVDGPLDAPGAEQALHRAHTGGYLDTGSATAQEGHPT